MPFVPIAQHPGVKNYDRGDVLREHSSASGAPAQTTVAPEWRVGMFSVILPMPEACITGPDGSRVSALSNSWRRGRYEGLSRTTFPRHEGAREGEAPFMYSIYNGPRRRFRETVGRAVGLLEGEKDGAAGTAAVAQESVACHLLIDPTDAATSFPIPEDGGVGTARILLRAIELIEHDDPGAGGDHALHHCFLVLHIAVVDCTSATLSAVSQAMNRPRNTLRVDRPASVAPFQDTPKYADDLRALEYYAQYAFQALQDALGSDYTVSAKLEAGGYITARAHGRRVSPQALVPRPTRVVLAVPGSCVQDGPAILSGGNPNPGDAWTSAQQWAWSLATGVDQYAETLPRQTAAHAARAMCGDYRRWTVWAESFGLGIVRHHVRLDEDPVRIGQTPLMQLAQTRYVDLAILTMRQFSILGHLTARLSAIESRDPGVGAGTDDVLRTLRERLMELEQVQSGMVRFRESLWFRNIPHHEIDTLVLERLRDTSGVQRLHDDFSEDLSFRQEVYRTQYTAAEVDRSRVAEERQREQAEVRRLEGERLEAEREAQRQREAEEQRLRDAADRAQEEHNERLTQILAVVALALTVPALVESFGFWAEPGAGWMTLTITAAVAVLGFFVVSAFSRRRTEARDRARAGDSAAPKG